MIIYIIFNMFTWDYALRSELILVLTTVGKISGDVGKKLVLTRAALRVQNGANIVIRQSLYT